MNNVVAIEQNKQPIKLLDNMAHSYGMDTKAFQATVMKTCMPQSASMEEFAAFLLVANKYKLNPITKEIYAFPKKGGGIQPIVGVDGWMNLINSQPSCDGLEFIDHADDEGNLSAITCRIYRKDRSHPTEVTEYMAECRIPNSQVWQKWPARMLRHKAAIQCARYAFGFAGIIDPDEAERSPEVLTSIVAPPPPVEHEDVSTAETSDASFDFTAFYEDLEINLQAAKVADDVEQIWADMDVDRICADDMDVALTIKNRRLSELEAA